MSNKKEKELTVPTDEELNPNEVKLDTKKVTIDKALYEVVFQKRWLNPEGKIVEIGDKLSIDKQLFDKLSKHKIVEEI